MGSGIRGLEQAYDLLFTGILIVLALLVMLCLVRAIIGPRIADRIVSVNMMGTMVIVIIAVLALMLGEGYLADICIIYAMISFLAVIVLTKVYMGVYLEKHRLREQKQAESGSEVKGIKQTESGSEVNGIKQTESGSVENGIKQTESGHGEETG